MSLKRNIIAFIIIGLLGTLGHFLYDWSGENKLIGYFFSVNESTWEHLKLLFFPTIIFSVFEYFFMKDRPENYIPAVVISLLCGMTAIVVLYYTYSGILWYNVDFINIGIYYIGLLLSLMKKEKIIREKSFSLNLMFWIFLLIGLIIALAFIFWTYNPPSLGIFTPPLTT